ncbi:MAG: prepilin-type N-terminal cleavage/methylation domain-containing protein [Candidatus Gastranaerophilales bacterium]|nr:prepilin-type N-terminal cleavage/methylation domain-containing protein [Candidatus Gastranaerophilales bacterium]
MRKRFLAFTLSEVLVVLVIIGIVAGLTIPSVITDFQKKTTATSLKKAYTDISQAVKLSEIYNGPVTRWVWATQATTHTAEEAFNKYWKPYFKTIKLCPHWRDCGYEANNGSAFLYKMLLSPGQYSSFSVQSNGSRSLFVLANGSIIFIVSGNTNTGGVLSCVNTIFIDLNGTKEPNTIGKDVFTFQTSLTSSQGVVSYKADETNLCNKGETDHYASYYCAGRIMQDGWQITDDYPW